MMAMHGADVVGSITDQCGVTEFAGLEDDLQMPLCRYHGAHRVEDRARALVVAGAHRSVREHEIHFVGSIGDDAVGDDRTVERSVVSGGEVDHRGDAHVRSVELTTGASNVLRPDADGGNSVLHRP